MPARSFPGDAIVTTITADINSSDDTIAIAASDGWGSGSGGRPFCVRIESEDGTQHEKVLIASRTGLNLTVSARGYDETTAQGFLAGARIWPVLDAGTIEALTDLLYDTTADFLTQYLTEERHAEQPHRVGDELEAPGTPTNVVAAADEGSSEKVAREDHAHALDPSIAGPGLEVDTGVLGVVVDDATLTVSGDSLIVKDDGISTAEDGATSKLAAQAVWPQHLHPKAIEEAALDDDAVESRAIGDGQVLKAHLEAALPRGILAKAPKAVDTADWTTETTVPTFSPTATVGASREVSLKFEGRITCSDSGGTPAVRIKLKDGATVIAEGVQPLQGNGIHTWITFSTTYVPSAGARTWTMTLTPAGSATDVGIRGATNTAVFSAVDEGSLA